jgi:RNA polymerase sigma-70 factor, ECF subfamily
MYGETSTPAEFQWPRDRKGAQALTGDEADFTSLVQRQARFVFRVAYAVLLNPHDAEDAVQEIFLKLYRNNGWRQAENERAFLARAAWRAAVDMRRRLGSQPGASPQIDLEDLSAAKNEPGSPQPGPEAAVITADRHAAVHTAIDSLPEELRMPLLLSSFEELNSREIGRILSIPEGTVRTRLQRARELLRRKLAGLEVHHV